jgi:hypothetical protein
VDPLGLVAPSPSGDLAVDENQREAGTLSGAKSRQIL